MSNRVGVERTFFSVLVSTWTFYISRFDSYNETQCPTGDSGQVKSYVVGL
jgi:hypothetical protein